MKRTRISIIVVALTALACLSILAGCGSSKADMLTECSGTWKNDKGDETVKIQLVGDSQRIVVNGDAYPASIKSVDNGTNVAVLNVQKSDGSSAEWMLQQRWNDNGSAFSLLFSHDGNRDVLTQKS